MFVQEIEPKNLIVPNDLITSNNLSNGAVHLYTLLLCLLPRKSFPLGELAGLANVSTRQIQRWLAELRRDGWLETTRGNGFNTYHLTAVAE